MASSHLLRGAGVIVALGVGPLVAHLRPEAARPVGGLADHLWASRRFDLFVHVGLMLVGALGIRALLPEDDEEETPHEPMA